MSSTIHSTPALRPEIPSDILIAILEEFHELALCSLHSLRVISKQFDALVVTHHVPPSRSQ